MSEGLSPVVRTVIPTVLIGASLISDSGVGVAQTGPKIEPAPTSGQHTQITGAPSSEYFRENFRVNQDSFPHPAADTLPKETVTLPPVDYWTSSLNVIPSGVRAVVFDNDTRNRQVVQGSFDQTKGELKLTHLATVPSGNYFMDTSKTDPNISVIAGESAKTPGKGGIMVTKDGGKNWISREVDGRRFASVRLTSDNRYVFLFPEPGASAQGTKTLDVYRYDIAKDAFTKQSIPGLDAIHGLTVTTGFFYDRASDSYTHFAGTERNEGFYKITYYPEQVGVIHYIMNDEGPSQIEPFVNAQGEFVLWYLGFNGKISEIKDNTITRVVRARLPPTAPSASTSISTMVLDTKHDRAYLGVNYLVSDPKNYAAFPTSYPVIETTSLSAAQPLEILESNDEWPKTGAILRLNLMQNGDATTLVTGIVSNTKSTSGLYFEDVSLAGKSLPTWKKAFSRYTTRLPFGAREKPSI